jgi:integrase
MAARKAERCNYHVDFRVKLEGGYRRRRECVGTSLTDAQDADAKRRVQKREKRPVFEMIPEKMTFQDLTDWYLKLDYVKNRKYAPTLALNLRAFNRTFGTRSVTSILPSDLKEYQVARKAAGYSDSYVDQELGAAKRAIYEAHANKKAAAETVLVFKGVRGLLKRNANARKRVLTPAEFERLLVHLPTHTLRVLAIAYYTGMRKGEIINLTWDKVDLDHRWIDLAAEDTKTDEARRIPIGDELLDLLKSIPRDIHDNYVIHYRGKPIRADVRMSVRAACAAAGIVYGRRAKDGFTLHSLRHTFNTMMRKAGVEESVIMNITGHRTYQMFLRYDTIDDADREAAIKKHSQIAKNGDQVVTKQPKALKKSSR